MTAIQPSTVIARWRDRVRGAEYADRVAMARSAVRA
jgi:hypothetical protein